MTALRPDTRLPADPNAGEARELEVRVLAKLGVHILPLMFTMYVTILLIRGNLGLAALAMNRDLGLSAGAEQTSERANSAKATGYRRQRSDRSGPAMGSGECGLSVLDRPGVACLPERRVALHRMEHPGYPDRSALPPRWTGSSTTNTVVRNS